MALSPQLLRVVLGMHHTSKAPEIVLQETEHYTNDHVPSLSLVLRGQQPKYLKFSTPQLHVALRGNEFLGHFVQKIPDNLLELSFQSPQNEQILFKDLVDNFSTIVQNYEFQIICHNKTRSLSLYHYPLLEDNTLKGAVVLLQDITEHKQLQQQLLQNQKMDAIGLLASGITHDFKNMLSYEKL